MNLQDKPQFFRLQRRLCTITHAQLAENIAHMVLDCSFCEIKFLSNLAIGSSLYKQFKYLAFTLSKLLNLRYSIIIYRD